MAAVTSELMNVRTASTQHLGSNTRQFLIYSRFVFAVYVLDYS